MAEAPCYPRGPARADTARQRTQLCTPTPTSVGISGPPVSGYPETPALLCSQTRHYQWVSGGGGEGIYISSYSENKLLTVSGADRYLKSHRYTEKKTKTKPLRMYGYSFKKKWCSTSNKLLNTDVKKKYKNLIFRFQRAGEERPPTMIMFSWINSTSLSNLSPRAATKGNKAPGLFLR